MDINWQQTGKILRKYILSPSENTAESYRRGLLFDSHCVLSVSLKTESIICTPFPKFYRGGGKCEIWRRFFSNCGFWVTL